MNRYIEFHHNRWLNSRFRLLASPDVKSAGFDLISIAHTQSPIGTLPQDDKKLALLLRLDLATWLELKSREISPLHNWYLARFEDEVRYCHPVVMELLGKARGAK